MDLDNDSKTDDCWCPKNETCGMVSQTKYEYFLQLYSQDLSVYFLPNLGNPRPGFAYNNTIKFTYNAFVNISIIVNIAAKTHTLTTLIDDINSYISVQLSSYAGVSIVFSTLCYYS